MPLFLVRRKVDSEQSHDNVPAAEWQYRGTFTTRAAADEAARRLDLEAKLAGDPTTHRPFEANDWEGVSALPPLVLRDWLRDADIEPPAELGSLPKREQKVGELHLWRQWWDLIVGAGDLSRSQWERVWLGLNRYSLYEVEQSEPDAALRAEATGPQAPAVVYAVVHRSWEYDDCWYCGGNSTLQVYRTRHAAEQARLAARTEKGNEEQHWNGGPNEFVVVELPLDRVAE